MHMMSYYGVCDYITRIIYVQLLYSFCRLVACVQYDGEYVMLYAPDQYCNHWSWYLFVIIVFFIVFIIPITFYFASKSDWIQFQKNTTLSKFALSVTLPYREQCEWYYAVDLFRRGLLVSIPLLFVSNLPQLMTTAFFLLIHGIKMPYRWSVNNKLEVFVLLIIFVSSAIQVSEEHNNSLDNFILTFAYLPMIPVLIMCIFSIDVFCDSLKNVRLRDRDLMELGQFMKSRANERRNTLILTRRVSIEKKQPLMNHLPICSQPEGKYTFGLSQYLSSKLIEYVDYSDSSPLNPDSFSPLEDVNVVNPELEETIFVKKKHVESNPPPNAYENQSAINEIVPIEYVPPKEPIFTTVEEHQPDPFDSNKSLLTWMHVATCVKYEMWPKLASVIKALVNNKNQNTAPIVDVHDLSEKSVDNVIDILKKKNHLPLDECKYLKHLILRAKKCNPKEFQYHPTDVEYLDEDVTKPLLMDIFDVHRIFVFANFNFTDYVLDDFKANIAESGHERLEEFANLSFPTRLNLYPVYIIEDNIFRVFEYHFGASLYVNTLKHTLYVENKQCFEVKCVVIPQSVSCIYDDHIEHVPFKDYNDIGTIENYLARKQITDFCKIRFKSNTIKNISDIAQQIEQLYNVDDITSNTISNLMIIIDRRSSDETKYDAMYIFPYQKQSNFPLLEANYFLGIHFKVVRNNKEDHDAINVNNNNNKVIAYFKCGLMGAIRFFPQMLVSVIPRLFRKPRDLSPSKYLYKLYDNAFKNGWCVTLDDSTFETYYKTITKYTHICVNYNRHILYDEFHTSKPMLCFTDLLHHELESNHIFNCDDIRKMNSFFDENEYCTDSIVDDIWYQPSEGSNIEIYMISKGKYNQFGIIKTVVCKYNAPSQKEQLSICSSDHVFNPGRCSFIQIIIHALTQLKKINETEKIKLSLNISALLGAYDHLVAVHGFSASINKTEDNKVFKPFEGIDHKQNMSNAHRYILDRIGGYCKKNACPILHKHILRRRERQIDEKEEDKSNDEDSLEEILHATLNALHCYILHEKKELYRLKRKFGDSHFITPMIEHKAQQEDVSLSATPNLNFGESVLKWLDYSERPTFDGFHDEIIHNHESTITEQTFLSYAQECYMKMNYTKYEQYLLHEIMALKIYTDTNIFQSSLRKAHWKLSTKGTKKSFYHWALLLYKTALFHSKPIPPAYHSKAPQKLYHGLNQLFILDNERPKYNGPTSTSLDQHVAHSFSKGIGLLLNIAPSYVNQFRFLTGIRVAWISHHKNEEEVLLIDQYLPITSTINFDTDAKNNADHLLCTVKSYTNDISNKDQFYAMLGTPFCESWVPFIVAHNLLYVPIDKDPNVRVLDVLVKDLAIKQLYNKHKFLSSKFEFVKAYKMLSYCLYRLNIKHHTDDCYFEDAEYKVISDGNDRDVVICKYNEPMILKKSCIILVKNEKLLGGDYYVKLQEIFIDHKSVKNELDNIENNLANVQDKIIKCRRYYDQIVDYKFVLLGEYIKKTNRTQITPDTAMNCANYVYECHNIHDLQFIIPFTEINNWDIFVQVEDGYNFVFLISFKTKTREHFDASARIEYILQIIQVLDQPIKEPADLFSKMGCNMTKKDLLLIKLNKIIYESPTYNPAVCVMGRLISELQMHELAVSHKAFTLKSKFKIHVFGAFNCFGGILDIDQEEAKYADAEYKISDDNIDDKCVTVTARTYTEPVSFMMKDDNLKDKSYTIYIRNEPLFDTTEYLVLQEMRRQTFSECYNEQIFADCLQMVDDKIITVLPSKLRMIYHQQVLDSKFVLQYHNDGDVCTEQISAGRISEDSFVYQFERINNIRFIVPFRTHSTERNYKIVIYAQFMHQLKFVLVTTFEVINSIQPPHHRRTEVDYLLQILKLYDRPIDNKETFYDKLGIALSERDIAIIKKNNIIHEKSGLGYKTVLFRLIDELQCESLRLNSTDNNHVNIKKKTIPNMMRTFYRNNKNATKQHNMNLVITLSDELPQNTTIEVFDIGQYLSAYLKDKNYLITAKDVVRCNNNDVEYNIKIQCRWNTNEDTAQMENALRQIFENNESLKDDLFRAFKFPHGGRDGARVAIVKLVLEISIISVRKRDELLTDKILEMNKRKKHEIRQFMEKYPDIMHLPLHKFTAELLSIKIQEWVYNDVNYIENLQKTRKILENRKLSGTRIMLLGIDDVKKIVMDELTMFITVDTFNLMFEGLNAMMESVQVDDHFNIHSKTWDEISLFLYNYPLGNLLHYIKSEEIDGRQFIDYYKDRRNDWIKNNTGWKSDEIYQINCMLFRHHTLSKEEIELHLDFGLKHQFSVSKFDLEELDLRIRRGQNLNDFCEFIANMIDKLKTDNKRKKDNKEVYDIAFDNEDIIKTLYDTIANAFIAPHVDESAFIDLSTQRHWMCYNCGNYNFSQYINGKMSSILPQCRLCGIEENDSISMTLMNKDTYVMVRDTQKMDKERSIQIRNTISFNFKDHETLLSIQSLIEHILASEREKFDLSCSNRTDNERCPSVMRLVEDMLIYKQWLDALFLKKRKKSKNLLIDITIKVDVKKFVDNDKFKTIFMECAQSSKKQGFEAIEALQNMLDDEKEGMNIDAFLDMQRQQFARKVVRYTQKVVKLLHAAKLFTLCKTKLRTIAHEEEFGNFLSTLDMERIDKDYHHILRVHINEGNRVTIENVFRFFELALHFCDGESEIVNCRSAMRTERRRNTLESPRIMMETTPVIAEEKDETVEYMQQYNNNNDDDDDEHKYETEQEKDIWKLKQYYVQSQLDTMHTFLVHTDWKDYIQANLRKNIRQKTNDESSIENLFERSRLRGSMSVSQSISVMITDHKHAHKFVTETTDTTKYEFGVDHSHIHLKPRFKCLRDELMKNSLNPISIQNYQQLLTKAIKKHHIATREYTNELSCKYFKSEYNIIRNEMIGIRHILAIITYTDMSAFCTAFLATYRKIKETEREDQITRRHIQLYWYSRFLFEAVEFFGHEMDEKIKVYHGLNKVLNFERFTAYFNHPVSCTTSFVTAQRFSAGDGVILKLKCGSMSTSIQPKYLSVSWLSVFPNEDEKLFYGDNVFFEICDIIEAKSNKSHAKELIMLNKFQKMVKNQRITWQTSGPKSGDDEESKMLNDLVSLITDQRETGSEIVTRMDTEEEEKYNSHQFMIPTVKGFYITAYGKSLFKYFCNNANRKWICIKNFKSLPSQLKNALFIEQREVSTYSRFSLIPLLRLFGFLQDIVLNDLNIKQLTEDALEYIAAVSHVVQRLHTNRLGKIGKHLQKIEFQSTLQFDGKQSSPLRKLASNHLETFKKFDWLIKYEFRLESTHCLVFTNDKYGNDKP